MRLLGVGYRRPLARWIESRPPQVQCLELTAEHFYDSDEAAIRRLRSLYPLMVHGLGLSLGTPGPLRSENFERVVRAADPMWISEHVAFTRTAEVDLGHLNPVRPDHETLRIMADHARELAARCGKPLILENITTHLRVRGPMSETEFLNRLCERAGCGLLLDVTNLYINSRNHGFDPAPWLREIEPSNIVQLHVVGYSTEEGRWQDRHACAIQPELLDLVRAVLDYAPAKAVIVERDENIPADLSDELEALRV